jgi:hypothetical protein
MQEVAGHHLEYRNRRKLPKPVNTRASASLPDLTLAAEPDNGESTRLHRPPTSVPVYTIPDSWANLSELAPILPVENPNELSLYRHRSLEEFRIAEKAYEQGQKRRKSHDARGGSRVTSGNKDRRDDPGMLPARFCASCKCVVM